MNELVRITTAGTVSSDTMCELLHKTVRLGLRGPITWVLDNARYQRCLLVMNLAATLGIRLQLLPSYSPSLNLIERLWKFVNRVVLCGLHYKSFADFCQAIDSCLDAPPTHKAKLATLMTHQIQRFDEASFLTV